MISVQLKATHFAWGVDSEPRSGLRAKSLTPDRLRALARAAGQQMFGEASRFYLRGKDQTLFEVAVTLQVIETVQVMDRGVDSSVTFYFRGNIEQLRAATDSRLLELGLSAEEVVRGGAVLLALSSDPG